MKTNHLLLLILLVCFSTPLLAQDTEEDPYADYSYLWEDPKAKAKEAKRVAKEEKKRQKELKKMRKQGLVPKGENASVPVDTVIVQDTLVQQKTILSDSLTMTQDQPDTLSADSSVPNTYSPDPDTDELDDSQSFEKPAEPYSTKKERHSVEDFRSGMEGSEGAGSFNGGFTFTVIDGQYYAGLILSPEFKIGKVGLGLNIPVLYGLDDKSIRTEIFEDGVGPARLISYLRYGVQKRDPVYVKVGQLNNLMIGFGSLINNYTNTTSYEKRKVGIHYDFNVNGIAGVDGLYSDFNPESMNLLAIRPYVRPLGWTGIPVANTLEIGATYIQDKDQTSLGTGDSTYTYSFTEEGIKGYGFDIGMNVLRVPFIQIDLFGSYSKLNVASESLTNFLETAYLFSNEPSMMSDGFQDGSGLSAGINFRFHFIADILSTDVRVERLSYTDHYLPQFFDATYELNKDARLLALGGAGKMSGLYGSVTGHVLKKVRLGGSLMLPDELSETSPATVQLHADLERLADKFTLNASYIKGNISDLGDAFQLDERSLAKVRLIYHLNKFLVTGVDYFWAFTPTPDGDYVATSYVSPYFGVSIGF